MKKIISMLFLIILLSGCSVDYQLEINEDFTLEENLYLVESKVKLLEYGDNVTSVINEMVNFYTNEENNIEPKVEIENLEFDRNYTREENIKYNFNKSFKSLNEYNNSLFFRYYFKDTNVISDSETYTIFASNFNFDNVNKLTNDYKYKFNVDKIYITIKLPFEVLESNAIKVDKETNTYYWSIEKDNYDRNQLIIRFSKNNKVLNNNYENNSNVFENAIGDIITNVSGGKIDGNETVEDNRILLYGTIIIIVIGIVSYFVMKKIRKANQI